MRYTRFYLPIFSDSSFESNSNSNSNLNSSRMFSPGTRDRTFAAVFELSVDLNFDDLPSRLDHLSVLYIH